MTPDAYNKFVERYRSFVNGHIGNNSLSKKHLMYYTQLRVEDITNHKNAGSSSYFAYDIDEALQMANGELSVFESIP